MEASDAVPILQVTDLSASLKYYGEVLGFVEDFRSGQYAGIRLGGACLHLCSHRSHSRPVGGGTVSVFCDEVDRYCAEVRNRGAQIKTGPATYDYGRRDFMIVDPDGNHLSFGCEAEAA